MHFVGQKSCARRRIEPHRFRVGDDHVAELNGRDFLLRILRVVFVDRTVNQVTLNDSLIVNVKKSWHLFVDFGDEEQRNGVEHSI